MGAGGGVDMRGTCPKNECEFESNEKQVTSVQGRKRWLRARVAASARTSRIRGNATQQGDTLGHDRLLTADRPNAFSGLGLHANLIWLNLQKRSQLLSNRPFEGPEFGFLSKYDAVQI